MRTDEVVAQLEAFGVPSSISSSVRDAVETAEGLGGHAHAWPTRQYVAVAASQDSSVGLYVHPSGLSLVLDPDEAREAALRYEYLTVDEKNSQTVILWARREAVEESGSSVVVLGLMKRALVRSAGRSAQARSVVGPAGVVRTQPSCPVHNVEMLGGTCDLCD